MSEHDRQQLEKEPVLSPLEKARKFWMSFHEKPYQGDPEACVQWLVDQFRKKENPHEVLLKIFTHTEQRDNYRFESFNDELFTGHTHPFWIWYLKKSERYHSPENGDYWRQFYSRACRYSHFQEKPLKDPEKNLEDIFSYIFRHNTVESLERAIKIIQKIPGDDFRVQYMEYLRKWWTSDVDTLMRYLRGFRLQPNTDNFDETWSLDDQRSTGYVIRLHCKKDVLRSTVPDSRKIQTFQLNPTTTIDDFQIIYDDAIRKQTLEDPPQEVIDHVAGLVHTMMHTGASVGPMEIRGSPNPLVRKLATRIVKKRVPATEVQLTSEEEDRLAQRIDDVFLMYAEQCEWKRMQEFIKTVRRKITYALKTSLAATILIGTGAALFEGYKMYKNSDTDSVVSREDGDEKERDISGSGKNNSSITSETTNAEAEKNGDSSMTPETVDFGSGENRIVMQFSEPLEGENRYIIQNDEGEMNAFGAEQSDFSRSDLDKYNDTYSALHYANMCEKNAMRSLSVNHMVPLRSLSVQIAPALRGDVWSPVGTMDVSHPSGTPDGYYDISLCTERPQPDTKLTWTELRSKYNGNVLEGFLSDPEPCLSSEVLTALAPSLAEAVKEAREMPVALGLKHIEKAVQTFLRYEHRHEYADIATKKEVDRTDGRHAYLEEIIRLKAGQCKQAARLLEELLAHLGVPSFQQECHVTEEDGRTVREIMHVINRVFIRSDDLEKRYLAVLDGTPEDMEDDQMQQHGQTEEEKESGDIDISTPLKVIVPSALFATLMYVLYKNRKKRSVSDARTTHHDAFEPISRPQGSKRLRRLRSFAKKFLHTFIPPERARPEFLPSGSNWQTAFDSPHDQTAMDALLQEKENQTQSLKDFYEHSYQTLLLAGFDFSEIQIASIILSRWMYLHKDDTERNLWFKRNEKNPVITDFAKYLLTSKHQALQIDSSAERTPDILAESLGNQLTFEDIRSFFR